MAVIPYPDWLPLSQRAQKNRTHQTHYRSDQPAVGAPIFQPMTDDIAVTWNVSWIFTLQQERAFWQWIRSDKYLNNGSNWFSMLIDLGGSGLQLQELHFTADGLPVQSNISGGTVTWTGTVIARELNNTDDQYDDIIVELPPVWWSWLDEVINRDLPQVYMTPILHMPINMLSSTLDSRIVYDGPQVYYINRNGNLVQSAANEWPLTFIDGVAVGRVPPETAAENILPDSRDLNGANWSLRSRIITTPNTDMLFNGVESSSLVPTTATGAHYMGGGISLAPIGTKLTCSVIAKANTASTLQTLYFGGSTGVSELYANFDLGAGVVSAGSAEDKLIHPLGNGWYYCAMSVVITGDMSVNRQFIISPAASPSSTRLATFAGDGVSGISVAHSQVEKSEFSTSPIVTEASLVVRPTASAKVAMNGATSIDITYSDGSVVNVQAVDDYAAIPQADSAWGSKYITTIKFNV